MDSSKMEIASLTFQRIIWKVRDFSFQLLQETGSFLDSPDFLFSGDVYCIRLYPEAKSEEGNVLQFHVRRLSFNFQERDVPCAIGLRICRDGVEFCDYVSSSLEQNISIQRSWIENERDVYVPDGNLTIVCNMRLESDGEDEQGGFTGRNYSFSTRWNPTEMELTTESPCAHVQLIVPHFLELLREKVDSLTSPEFRFAGDTFRLRFRPNADTGDTDLNLVRLTSTFTERRVCYRVGHGDLAVPRYHHTSSSLVSTTGLCASLSELEAQREKYIWDDTLCVVLFLHLGEESSAGAEIFDAAHQWVQLTGFNKLQFDYGQLLQKGTESDACVIVRGKEFRVHRAVLRARSTVFEAMFGHDTSEKDSGRVVIDDLEPNSFGQFLEYLYAGHVRAGLSDDNAFGLYEVADKYDVSTLKSECVDHMRRNISLDCFCDVVTLALRHHEEDLLTVAIRFFQDNIPDIIATARWQQFVLDYGATVNEFLMKTFVPKSES